jgi:hypothetical protein
MTTKQLNKLTMSLASEDICDANAILLPSVPAFADAYADVQSHVTNIQTFSQNQSQDITGIARDKQQARLAMCNIALPIAGAIHAYATKTDNNELEAKSDFSLSDLMAGRDSASAERCQNIYADATANLADLASHGITAAKLALLKAAIAAYNLLISKPRDSRVKGKTITGSIETEFTALDKAFSIMDDLIPQFAPANQQFVDDYNNARTIVDAAASHASPTPPTPPPAPPHP